jgi:hypothetical protein
MALFANSGRNFINFDFEDFDLNREACQNAFANGLIKDNLELSMSHCKIGLENLDLMLSTAPKLQSIKFCAIERSAVLDWKRAMNNSPQLMYQSDVTHLTERPAKMRSPMG